MGIFKKKYEDWKLKRKKEKAYRKIVKGKTDAAYKKAYLEAAEKQAAIDAKKKVKARSEGGFGSRIIKGAIRAGKETQEVFGPPKRKGPKKRLAVRAKRKPVYKKGRKQAPVYYREERKPKHMWDLDY